MPTPGAASTPKTRQRDYGFSVFIPVRSMPRRRAAAMLCRGLHDALFSTMKSGKALGAISEVATRRSEFAAIPKTEGIDGLISALNRKAEILATSAARTF
jgi:hypothetical protein